MKPQVCPACEQGTLHAEHSFVNQTIGNASASVAHHIHWCDACGLEITTPEDARENARAMRAAERQVQGKLTGAQIAELRKSLGLTQEVAGRVFGGGPVAFCKYEKDDLSPTDAMDNLLWLIRKKPALTCALAERNDVPYVAPKHIADNQDVEIKFEASGLEVGRRMVQTISAAIDEAKHVWMPGVWAIKDREASNQSSITLTEQSLSGLAA